MPEEMPADIEITMHYDGGMMDESENFFISADSSWWRMRENGLVNRYAFKTDHGKLKELYSTLKKENAINIQAEEESEVYDRGGSSYSIAYNKKEYDVSNAQNSFIRDKWSENYGNITSAISKFVHDGIADQKVKIHFSISGELPDSIQDLVVTIGKTYLINWSPEKNEPMKTEVEVSHLPGEYNLDVYLVWGEKERMDLYEQIKIDSSGLFEIKMNIVNDSLILEK